MSFSISIFHGRYIRYIVVILTFILLTFQLFQNLTNIPIRLWDESRLAISVLEMLKNENYLVVHFSDKPDLWNTKPPLLIWIQVVLSKIIGYSYWSIRLPSALAGLFTCSLIGIFAWNKTGKWFMGVMAALILVCFDLYVGIHGTRTGDYDALLALWTTSYGLLFIWFLEKRKSILLYLFSVSVVLAVLTKGVAGLLFLPGLMILILYYRAFSIFRNPHLYINLVACIISISLYYGLRELASSGYLEAVWESELGGRFFSTLDDHQYPFHHYFERIWQSSWLWSSFFLVGIGVGFLSKDKSLKNVIFATTILGLTHLLIISLAGTKLHWYAIPALPYISLTAAAGVYVPVRKTARWLNRQICIPETLTFILAIALIFTIPYYRVYKKNAHVEELAMHAPLYDFGYLLQSASAGKVNVNDYHTYFLGYTPNVWADLAIARRKGIDLSFTDPEYLEVGAEMIVWQPEVIEKVKKHNVVELTRQEGSLHYYQVQGKK